MLGVSVEATDGFVGVLPHAREPKHETGAQDADAETHHHHGHSGEQEEKASSGGADGQLVATNQAQRLHLFLEEPSSSLSAQVFSFFVLGTIVASIVAFVLQTVPAVKDSLVWVAIDYVSLVIFSAEYFSRLGVCNAFKEQTRWEFVKAPGNIVDLMSLFPVFLLDDFDEMKPIRVLRAIRLVRIFRVFKLSKYSAGMNLMIDSLVNSARPLSILGLLLGIGVLLLSSLVYHAERLSCPSTQAMSAQDFENYRQGCADLGTGWSADGNLCCDRRGSPDDFPSIAAAFWWSMVTMTTVGYGDKTPRSFLGRIVGCMAMVSGIVLLSLPVAIVGSKFEQGYEKMEQEAKKEAEELARRQRQEKGERTDSPQPSHGSGDGPPGADGQHEAEGCRTGERLHPIRKQLLKLDGAPNLTNEARYQIALLMELFDHLDCVERRLRKLKAQDSALDALIRTDFAAVAMKYGCRVLTERMGS